MASTIKGGGLKKLGGYDVEEEKGYTSGGVPQSGRYTYSLEDAVRTAEYHGVGYHPTTYNGREAYYIDKAQREVKPGTSGADEGILNDDEYARVQQAKDRYYENYALREKARASNDPEAQAQAQRLMDQAHADAQAIRKSRGYSGGVDGSEYIPVSVHEQDDGWDEEDYTGGSGRPVGPGGAASPGAGTSVIPVIPEKVDLTGSVEDHSDYLERMNAALKAAQLAELEEAYTKNMAALERAAQEVPDQYQAARNQTAAAAEQNRRNFAQYAAAAGLSNGAAGQAELARSIALQGDMNTLNTAQANTLADLELQRANAEVEYNSAIAKAQAAGDYQLAADLYQEKVRVQNALVDLQMWQQQFDLQRYQLQHQAWQAAIADQLAQDKFDFQKWQYQQALAGSI